MTEHPPSINLNPPPPPPPPPPLPPNPSYLPGSSSNSGSTSSSGRLRSVHWDRIPAERVKGKRSVWTKADEFPIDHSWLDELFGQCRGHKVKAHRIRGQHHGNNPNSGSLERPNAAEKVWILESRRSLKVGVFLHQFKSPLAEVISDVREGHGAGYGSEKLNELYKLLPDADEEERLKTFRGEHSQLDDADRFMLHLVEIPNVRLRLECMILQEELDPIVTSLSASARCLSAAAAELMACVELHSVLRLALKAGNYVNAGGFAGNAAGFKIASLLRLSDTKANRPGLTLLHFVATEAVKIEPSLLSFHLKLNHVGPAARLSVGLVQQEFQELRSRVAALLERVETAADMNTHITPFLQAAELRLVKLQVEVDAVCQAQQELLEFFCEDDDGTFRLEEACATFHTFQQRFLQAAQENALRERQDRSRSERERAEGKETEKRLSSTSFSDLEAEADEQNHALELILNTPLDPPVRRCLGRTWGRRSQKGDASPRQQPESPMETMAEKKAVKLQACAEVLDGKEAEPAHALATPSGPSPKATSRWPRPLGGGLRLCVGETHTLITGLRSYSRLAPPLTPPTGRSVDGGKKRSLDRKIGIGQINKEEAESSPAVQPQRGQFRERTTDHLKPADQTHKTRTVTPPLRASRLPRLRRSTPPPESSNWTSGERVTGRRQGKREIPAKRPTDGVKPETKEREEAKKNMDKCGKREAKSSREEEKDEEENEEEEEEEGGKCRKERKRGGVEERKEGGKECKLASPDAVTRMPSSSSASTKRALRNAGPTSSRTRTHAHTSCLTHRGVTIHHLHRYVGSAINEPTASIQNEDANQTEVI